jgi:hypothetical protein
MDCQQRRLLFIVLILTVSGSVRADNPSLPWTFNAPRAQGYAIDLVDVKPAPGTPLAAGHFVNFLVKVRYSLSIANHGTIVLVFEDENDHSAAPKGPQVMQKVDGPGGEVTLREGITVPTLAKELRLFVPLVPDGITHTTGEVTIRYPIT